MKKLTRRQFGAAAASGFAAAAMGTKPASTQAYGTQALIEAATGVPVPATAVDDDDPHAVRAIPRAGTRSTACTPRHEK